MNEPIPEEQGPKLPQRYGQPTALARFQQPAPQIQPFDEESISLADYLHILVRRKWLLIAVACTVLAVAFVQVFTTTPLYRAVVSLQVDPEDAKVLPYEEIAQAGGTLGKEEYLMTQAEKLKSRSLARRVVQTLQLSTQPDFTKPTRKGFLLDLVSGVTGATRRLLGTKIDAAATENALIDRLSGHLNVRPLRRTRLIKVSYDSPDPKLAAKIANSLAEEFIGQHLESKFESTTRATEFLAKQLDELKIKVEQSEESLIRYAQAKNIVNVNERETINRKKLADLSDELTQAESELITQTARYEAAARANLATFPEALKSQQIRDLDMLLAQRERQLAGLSGRYGPGWPAVRDLNLEIKELRNQLEIEKRQAIAAASAEYRLARDRRDRLTTALNEQRQTVDRLNEDSIQYHYLERDAESNKELYDGLLQRLKEAGVSAGLKSSNIQVADEASVPRTSASPKKTRSLLLAMVFGLFLGAGAVFLAEALDNTIKNAEDVVQQVGLPALGVVPSLSTDGQSRQGYLLRRPRQGQAPTSPILASGDSKGLRGRAWEAYRSLRTSLLLSHSGKPPQVILVTSALPGEGKTTTAANTAMAMAQTGARTLVIDLDMRKPALTETFGLTTNGGMSTYLSGNCDLNSQIQQTGVPNLFLLSAGPPAPNPPELLGSPRMANGLKLVREYFTHVVIDSPPTLELSDTLVLASSVDGVILVARSGKTPRQALKKAGDHLLRVGGQILGVLINDVDVRQSEYGSYGYGSYGGYDSYFSPSAVDSPEADSRKTA